MSSTTAPRNWPTVAVVLMLLVLLVVPGLLVVLGGWAGSDDGKNYLPDGGVDGTNGTVRIDDAWVHAPDGVPTDARADLRVQLTNDSRHGDALVGVSTPVAAHVRLLLHGKAVRRISLEARGARDLEWPSHGSGIELVGLHRPLQVGQWFPITFRFQRSSSITMQISVGPLGHGTR